MNNKREPVLMDLNVVTNDCMYCKEGENDAENY